MAYLGELQSSASASFALHLVVRFHVLMHAAKKGHSSLYLPEFTLCGPLSTWSASNLPRTGAAKTEYLGNSAKQTCGPVSGQALMAPGERHQKWSNPCGNDCLHSSVNHTRSQLSGYIIAGMIFSPYCPGPATVS